MSEIQAMTRKYDALVMWLEWSGRDYVRKSKWVRNIVAPDICAASTLALAGVKDHVCPSVSMIWPQTSASSCYARGGY